MRPYADRPEADDVIVRTFGEDVDPVELMWHRDNETRLIEAVGETDWMIQMEDELPKRLAGQILIKKHEWHRAIKGTGPLVIKIKKIQDEI